MRNIFKMLLAASAAMTVGFTASAQTPDWSAIKTSKTATPNGDGSYTLTLETYVTGSGSNDTQIVESSVPLDIVLVLDVSGSMDESMSGVYDDSGKTTADYSSLTYWFGTNRSYYVEYNGNYYPLNVTRSGFWLTGYTYKGSIEVDDSIVEDDSFTNKKLYTSVSKMDALKRATTAFVNKVSENSTDNVLHNISIVKFAGNYSEEIGNDTYEEGWWLFTQRRNYSQVVMDLTDSREASIVSTINDLKANGSTSADYGMTHAANILQNARSESQKVVVLFTDGEPNHGSGFTESVANSAISTSKSLKSSGVKVYSVGTFGSNVDEKVYPYMQALSSNYPNASAYNSLGDPAEKQTFSMTATTAEELENVFVTITEEFISDASKADIVLKTSDVTLRDVVTPYFVIPGGAKASDNVKVKKIAATLDSQYEIDLSFPGAVTDITNDVTVSIVTDDESGETTVDVQGFDFSENWVGYTAKLINGEETDKTQRVVHGSELVIEIIIVPNPDEEGGAVPTNSDASGVYVGDEKTGNDPEKVVAYDVPDTIFTPRDLKIQRSGLAPGESAIYVITRSLNGAADTSFSMRVVLTNTTGTDGAVALTVAKLAVKEGDAFYEYTVAEEHDWDWTFVNSVVATDTKVAPITKSLKDDNIFEFSDVKQSILPNNDETYKKK